MVAHGLSDASVRGLRELAGTEGVAVTVRGACMEPHLADGERIEVRAVRWLWPGDIVAVATSGRPVLIHRFLGYRPAPGGWRLVTAGDAAGGADCPVRPDQVIGRAVVPVPLRDRAVAVRRFIAFSLAAAARMLRR